jgi:hypothetical protein
MLRPECSPQQKRASLLQHQKDLYNLGLFPFESFYPFFSLPTSKEAQANYTKLFYTCNYYFYISNFKICVWKKYLVHERDKMV